MSNKPRISRRSLFAYAPAAGAAALAGAAYAQGGAPSGGPKPPSGDFVIRNAHVVSMDPQVGDLAKGDVVVRAGKIEAVAASAAAPDLAEIDGAGMICFPGMVDTHQHMWTTPFRGLVNEAAATSYGAAKPQLGPVSTPEDMYAAHMLAMTAALYAGVTTSNNLNHNCRGAGHSDAVLQAMVDSGQRGRFSFGMYDGLPATQLMDFKEIARVQKRVQKGMGDGRVSFGVFLRGPSKDDSSVFVQEVKKAKSMGLPISIDGANDLTVQLLGDNKALAGTVLVHCNNMGEAGRKAMAAGGAAHSCATWSELSAVLGMPVFLEMRRDGVLVSLSIDTVASPSDSNMFGLARITSVLAHTLEKDQFHFTHKTALEMATVNGAKALGLGDKIGSLTPGKRADLILVRTASLNLSPAPNLNPYRLLLSAQAEDVDSVFVDGRAVKYRGALTNVDPQKVIADASKSLTEMRARANWPSGPF
ncbi:MAG: amidohydrolase family protein [Hyphomonadaceae bacterium]